MVRTRGLSDVSRLRGELRRGDSEYANTALTVVKSVCPLDCPDTCSMLVTVKDGVAVELRGDPDHRFTRGFLVPEDGPVSRAGL